MTDWRPSASLDILKLRARMLAEIRAFFSERGLLEVETPYLSSAATSDPALASLATRYTGPLYPRGQNLYLHTSPEFPMKRLLAAGSGSIYQICKVFRDGESGRLHNPEFTLIEWYRVGFNHLALMDEVEALVRKVLADRMALLDTQRLSYCEAFERYTGLNPHSARATDFAQAARAHGIEPPASLDPHGEEDAWRDLLLTHIIEPQLGQGRLSFLYDYPASQASLARVRAGNPPLAERFELYLGGIELANGFHELADSEEQRARFQLQLQTRTTTGLTTMPLDENLLEALQNGLPACAGVALGFDRLVMLAAKVKTVQETLAFPINRA